MARKKRELTHLAELRCRKDVVISGRLGKGVCDTCFKEHKTYLFAVDKERKELITIDEVQEVHFVNAPILTSGGLDSYGNEHFDVLRVDRVDTFGLDEVSQMRYERLFRDRLNFTND